MYPVISLYKPKPQYVELEKPRMGGKIFLIQSKGLYVLEKGPALLRVIACTHAGSGRFVYIDGVPDENGFFSGENIQPEEEGYNKRNGKEIFKSHPAIMGSFALDAGTTHGLCVLVDGGHDEVNLLLTTVWFATADVIK